jgi:pimeloyl-ACP methyl ester carboxylesterase
MGSHDDIFRYGSYERLVPQKAYEVHREKTAVYAASGYRERKLSSGRTHKVDYNARDLEYVERFIRAEAQIRLASPPVRASVSLSRGQVESNVSNTYGDPAKVSQEVPDRSYELTLREGNRRALGDNLRQAQDVYDQALIKAIKVPTLIMWGSNDHVISMVPDAENFHRDIAASQLVIFEGSGHMPQEESPAETVAALRQFLDSHRHAIAT